MDPYRIPAELPQAPAPAPQKAEPPVKRWVFCTPEAAQRSLDIFSDVLVFSYVVKQCWMTGLWHWERT